MDRSRFGAYTSPALTSRYESFSPEAIRELQTFPTLFAYEQQVGQAARLGRIVRIAQPSSSDIRFRFELFEGVSEIPPETIKRLAWSLDFGKLEEYRTHWAVKDVDLIDVLQSATIVSSRFVFPSGQTARSPEQLATVSLQVRPTVFSLPAIAQSDRLVAVMMPFAPEFDPVYAAIRASCTAANLECQRADQVWEDTTIIQDVFNLLYRSRIVVADLTRGNPNVLYEVGIAHTLGRHVVPIAQEPVDRPFDIAHHRILGYRLSAGGIEQMTSVLTRRLTHLAG
jgi:hypothetical protein